MRRDVRGSENQQGELILVENRHKLPVTHFLAFFLVSLNAKIILSELRETEACSKFCTVMTLIPTSLPWYNTSK